MKKLILLVNIRLQSQYSEFPKSYQINRYMHHILKKYNIKINLTMISEE